VDSTDSELSTDGDGPGPGDSWGVVTTTPQARVRRSRDAVVESAAIAAGDQPMIYLTERYGSIGVVIGVDAGRYDLTLHFAETWHGNQTAGSRRFDIEVEGRSVAAGFDPMAEAGGFAIPTTVTVPDLAIDDGQLDLRLLSTDSRQRSQPPMINGLELSRR